MWIILKNNLNYFLIFNYKNKHLCLSCALRAKPFFLTNISSNGGVKHPICQPLKHWSQINIVTTPITYPHNIQQSLIRTITKDGSIRSSTLSHGAQLCTWSSHVNHLMPPTSTHQKVTPATHAKWHVSQSHPT
jgi:hypothetical protein